MEFNLPIIYLILSVVFTLFLSFYALHNPQGRTTKSFVTACLAAVLWMTGEVVERLSYSLAGRMTGQAICFIGVCFLPVAMLVFIYEYCGKSMSRKWIILLCIIPVISWVTVLTNPFHHLFFSSTEFLPLAPAKNEYGLYFWLVHLPYCYILSLLGFAAVLLERQKASSHYRPQITILFFALCIPLAVNVMGVFKIFGEASYTPLSFPVFFSIMTFAVFRYRFLKSSPIAYETVFQTIRDGVIVLDLDNIITDINPSAARSLGKTPKSIIGSRVEEAFAPWEKLISKYKDNSELTDLYDEIELELAGKKHFISVSMIPLKNRRGITDGRIFTLRDITDRKQYESSLEMLAFHDPLTRLPNRRKFEEEVAKILAEPEKIKENIALLYIDLNRFKSVNDTMGHAVGDGLLKHVAARVSSVLREPDLMCRLGGDEFAVLLYDCDRENIDLVIKRIIENVERPFKVENRVLAASLSIGAAFYPEDGTTVTELLQRADTAMYQAKQKGGSDLLELPAELNM